MTWYEQWFDRQEYELVFRDRDESDARRIVDLIRRTIDLTDGMRVLDVGCGEGRHTIELGRIGCDVTGLDLSARRIHDARHRARVAGSHVRFVPGDMREIADEGSFDVVVNLFTAFGFFDHATDHQRAITAMAHALKPDGVLVQDYLNAGHVRRHLERELDRQIGEVTIRERRWIEDDRIKKRIVFERSGDSESFMESIALLEPHEFEGMYGRAGLETFARLGTYDGDLFEEDSPRLILFARRTGEA